MRWIAVFTVGFALLAPAVALGAQGQTACPAGAQHGCAATSSASNADFPFTLLDVALLGAGASVLLAGGIAVRRLSAGEYDGFDPAPSPVESEVPAAVTLEKPELTLNPAAVTLSPPAAPPVPLGVGHANGN